MCMAGGLHSDDRATNHTHTRATKTKHKHNTHSYIYIYTTNRPSWPTRRTASPPARSTSSLPRPWRR